MQDRSYSVSWAGSDPPGLQQRDVNTVPTQAVYKDVHVSFLHDHSLQQVIHFSKPEPWALGQHIKAGLKNCRKEAGLEEWHQEVSVRGSTMIPAVLSLKDRGRAYTASKTTKCSGPNTHSNKQTHSRTQAYMNMHMLMCSNIHVFIHMHMCAMHAYLQDHSHIYTYTCSCTHTHTLTQTHAHSPMYTQRSLVAYFKIFLRRQFLP
jgi:hypothetical protein